MNRCRNGERPMRSPNFFDSQTARGMMASPTNRLATRYAAPKMIPARLRRNETQPTEMDLGVAASPTGSGLPTGSVTGSVTAARREAHPAEGWRRTDSSARLSLSEISRCSRPWICVRRHTCRPSSSRLQPAASTAQAMDASSSTPRGTASKRSSRRSLQTGSTWGTASPTEESWWRGTHSRTCR